MKAPAEREKAEKTRAVLAEREAARAAKTNAERDEEAFKAKFREHQHSRTDELISKQNLTELGKLGEVIAGALGIRSMCLRWEEIGRQPSKLDRRKSEDKIIYGGYVVPEALKLWGQAEDNDLEAYRASVSEPA